MRVNIGSLLCKYTQIIYYASSYAYICEYTFIYRGSVCVCHCQSKVYCLYVICQFSREIFPFVCQLSVTAIIIIIIIYIHIYTVCVCETQANFTLNMGKRYKC